MELEGKEEQVLWLQEIPFVLDLLRENPEGIVDDTAVEKLLNWLQSVATVENVKVLLDRDIGILHFLSSREVVNHPLCLNFALRLSGIIGSVNAKCFNELSEKKILCRLFIEPVNTPLWNSSPSVRWGFFRGLMLLMKTKEGQQWTREKEFSTVALDAFSDSSYYVVQMAINFLGQYIVLLGSKLITSKLWQDTEVLLHRADCSKSLAVVLNYLKLTSIVFVKETTTALILLRKVGPLATIFRCLESVTREGSNAVEEAICLLSAAIEKSRSNDFSWVDIFGEDEGDSEEPFTPAEGIVSLALTLVKQGYLKSSVQFLAKLSVERKALPSGFPSFWNELLLQILMSLVLKRFDFNGLELDDIFLLVEYPNFSNLLEKSKILTSYVNEMTNDSGKWTEIFLTVLNHINEIFHKVVPNHCSSGLHSMTEKFIYFVLKLLDMSTCEVMQERFDSLDKISPQIINKNKVTISCLSFFKEFLPCQWFSELPQKIRLEVIDVVSDVSKRPYINATVVCQTIHLSSIFIGNLNNSLASAIFNSAVVEAEAEKTHLPSGISFDNNLAGRLVSVWTTLMSSERWEIQDSMLELVMVMLGKVKEVPPIEEFLELHHFWLKSWMLLKSEESYIRASAVKVIGEVVECEKLLAVFEKCNEITLEKIIDKLLLILREDDEAFARRSIMDVFIQWIQSSKIKNYDIKEKNSAEKLKGMKDFLSVPKIDQVVKALKIASEDFDWEVKLKGVHLWDEIIHSFFYVHEKNDELSTNSPDIKERLNSCVDFICSSNGSNILLCGLYDCDYPVREAAFQSLSFLQTMIKRESVTSLAGQKTLESLPDVEERLKQVDVTKSSEFSLLLLSLDLVSVGQFVKPMDTLVKSDPTSFLRDILAAARQHEENLLDCY